MAEKQYYWLKLEKDFFKQKEIKKLRKVAGGDTLTIIYLKMALLSLENDGVLIFEGIEDDFSEELSLELDEEPENILMVLSFLQKHRMIEQAGEDFYLNRIPEMTGKETGAAKRMRISRQRKIEHTPELALNERNNVTSLLQDVTNSYTEKELYLDKELEKEIDKELEKCNKLDYNEIQDYWNSFEKLPKIKVLSQVRKEKLKLRIAETSLVEFDTAIEKLSNSSFATGNNDRNWKVDFDWLVKNDTNIIKVLEGKYDNKTTEQSIGEILGYE